MQTAKTETEQIQWISAARSLIYKALARIFASESDKDMLAMLRSEELSDALEVICGSGITCSFAQRDDYEPSDYASLFLGPGAPEAAPWESSYVAVDGLVMGRSTLAVRESYSNAGFSALNKNRVPDDHVATELSFLGELCLIQNTERDQARFLDDHLLAWVESFSSLIDKSLPESAYADAAAFAVAFLKQDRLLIDELIAQNDRMCQIEGNEQND